MISDYTAIITGLGGYLPPKILTNKDLEKQLDTSDEWILSRTGIAKRHIADKDEYTSDMAVEASKKAIKTAGRTAKEVDLIIVATTTPDCTFPSTAVIIQNKLGIPACPAFDIQAVCSGFIYALKVASHFIACGQSKAALVIGADKMSNLLDWSDRKTCVLFGDGAGAVILEPIHSSSGRGIQYANIQADGAFGSLLCTESGPGSDKKIGIVKMHGQEVFKHAVDKMELGVKEALDATSYKVEQIDYLIPHQANARILKKVGKRLGLNHHQLVMTVDRHANTSAASIPLAMADQNALKPFKAHDIVVLESLGGGLTWGSVLLRW